MSSPEGPVPIQMGWMIGQETCLYLITVRAVSPGWNFPPRNALLWTRQRWGRSSDHALHHYECLSDADMDSVFGYGDFLKGMSGSSPDSHEGDMDVGELLAMPTLPDLTHLLLSVTVMRRQLRSMTGVVLHEKILGELSSLGGSSRALHLNRVADDTHCPPHGVCKGEGFSSEALSPEETVDSHRPSWTGCQDEAHSSGALLPNGDVDNKRTAQSGQRDVCSSRALPPK